MNFFLIFILVFLLVLLAIPLLLPILLKPLFMKTFTLPNTPILHTNIIYNSIFLNYCRNCI